MNCYSQQRTKYSRIITGKIGIHHLERRRSQSKVGADNFDALGEDLLGFLSGDAGMDNDIVTLLPVTGSGDLVLVAQLERVDDAQDFIKVTAGGCGVCDNQADSLLGINDEDRSNSERNTLGIDIGGILDGFLRVSFLYFNILTRTASAHLVIQHVIKLRDLTISISDDRELEVNTADVVDIGNPLSVFFETVGRQANDLDVALVKFVLKSGNETELSSADRSWKAR